MKLTLYALALIIMLALIGHIRITLSPFSISFGRGWLVLGVILIMGGLTCLFMQWYGDGLNKGIEMKQEVIEEIEVEKIKETI
jgi:hypothetical protein